jgi:hypothetical protein
MEATPSKMQQAEKMLMAMVGMPGYFAGLRPSVTTLLLG